MMKLTTLIGLILSLGTHMTPYATACDLSPDQRTQEKVCPPTIPSTQEIQMHILKFEEIVDMTKDLISKLPQQEWEGILAITRGGLAPAGVLSQHLNIRRIEVINMQSYGEDKTQGNLKVINEPNVPNGGENWLVIDDLSDTGTTFSMIRNLYPKAFLATLMVKPKGKEVVDLYSREFPQNIWIHFPWEPLQSNQ